MKQNIELLLKFSGINDIKKDINLLIKFETLISFCYLLLCDVNSAIKYINDSSNKFDIITNIIYTLNLYESLIFINDFLNFLLNNCNKNENYIVKIICKSINFVDYIELIYKNIELFKNIHFKLNITFQKEIKGKSEEIVPKIFYIIKNCRNLEIDEQFILKNYPNFIDILSVEEREVLLNILKDDNNSKIKKLIYQKNYSEAKTNSEIINLINSFNLWKYREEDDDIYRKFKFLDFQNMTASDLEKLKIIFKNYNFQYFQENTFGSKVFVLVITKLKTINDFPNILWYLFEPNLTYRLTNNQLNNIFNIYLDLFSKNQLSNSRENLFILTNQTFIWLIMNTENPEIFLKELEKTMNINAQEILLNEPIIIKLYTDFLSKYYNEENNSVFDYIINYLKTRIIKMDKETLEKILNIKDCTIKILVYFNQYKISRNDFFKKKSENIDLFKLIKEIPNNNYIINSLYFTNSQEIIQKIVIDLQSMNCTYQELLEIANLSNEELNKRFEILQIDIELKNKLKNSIKEKIKEFKNIKDKLILCKNYLQKMEITDNEDKIIYQKVIYLNSNFDNKNIKNITIANIEKSLNKDGFLNIFNNLYERAQKLEKIENFKTGKMFIKQVNIKLEKEENKFQEIVSNINEIKNIFDKETIFQIKEEKLEKFFNLFISEEELIEEITKLKELFMIDEEDELMMEFFKFNFLKEITKKIISSYINTLEILNLEYNTFTNIKKIIERISELNITQEDFKKENMKNKKIKLNEIISEFELMGKDFNLKIFPLDQISKMLKNLWENKLFEFLFHITNNDLRDLNSSLTGTSIDINDINNYLIVKQLLIFFKKQANYFSKEDEDEEENNEVKEENKINNNEKQNDDKFFTLIKNNLDDFIYEMKIIDINEIIINALNKKNQIEELLKNRSGYEKHREEINMIMNESLFKIFYTENFEKENRTELDRGYNCQVTFSNKEKKKYFKDLVEMQQIASLSQNKNQNNNILIKFIDIIDKIKDLLNYCKILTSKGYPDYFKFELSIKDNEENYFKNLTENLIKEKTLDEQNKELKKIIKKFENFQMEAYKDSRYLKFFSGQQLLKLNNFFKNKISDDKEKIEQINHLLIYLIGSKNLKLNKDYNYINYISNDNYIKENENDKENKNNISTSNKKKRTTRKFKYIQIKK